MESARAKEKYVAESLLRPSRSLVLICFAHFNFLRGRLTRKGLLQYNRRLLFITSSYKAIMEAIQTDQAPLAIGPYSQAIKANGFVFLSGQIPLVPETMQVIEGDIQAQTDRVFASIAAVLAAAGTALDKVVKTTVFLADMNDFTAMNEVYARYFGDHRPARSTVQAARLPRDVRVEIEVIALA